MTNIPCHIRPTTSLKMSLCSSVNKLKNKLELPFSEAIKPGKGGQTDQGLSSEGRFASCRRTFVVVCCISTTKSFFPPNLLQVQQYIGIALVLLLLPVLETSLDQTLHSCNNRVVVDHPRIAVLLRYKLDHEVGNLPICSLRAKLYQSTPSWSSVFVWKGSISLDSESRQNADSQKIASDSTSVILLGHPRRTCLLSQRLALPTSSHCTFPPSWSVAMSYVFQG